MNERDIEYAFDIVQVHAPEYLPYVKYLSEWRDIVNQNSDGWAYWKAGARCASDLVDLVGRLLASARGGGPKPSGKEFERAIVQIQRCAKRHKLPAPVFKWDPPATANQPPAPKFLVLSGSGPTEEWRIGDAMITPAMSRDEVRDLTIQAEGLGADTVLVFEWNGRDWILAPGEDT